MQKKLITNLKRNIYNYIFFSFNFPKGTKSEGFGEFIKYM